MKTIALLFCLLFVITKSHTQCVKTQISTDPENPVNIERTGMINSFDWTAEWFDLNCDNIDDTQIQSPFFQPNNENTNHFKVSGDRLPEDGWELLHYDMGSNLSSGSVDYPYFILYNRYTGILRVFIAVARISDHSAAQFTIYFNSENFTHLLSTGETLIPLDNEIETSPTIISPSTFINSDKMWFYADYTMMYDPCTCYADSKIVIKVDLIDNSEIFIQGETIGTLTSIEDGSGTVKNDASASVELSDLENAWNKGQKTYKSTSKFVKDVEKTINIDGKDDSELNSKELATRQDLNEFLESLSSSNFLKKGLKAAPYIGTAIALVDFFTSGGQESSEEISLTPMSINLQSTYRGTITTDYPYKTIIFNTPGTDNDDIESDDEYPYYNHALGVFNLLETPEINFGYECVLNSICGGYCFDLTTSSYYIPTSELKYVLNPAAGFDDNPEVFFSYFFEFNDEDMNSVENCLDNDGLLIQENDTIWRTRYLPTDCFCEVVPKIILNDHSGATPIVENVYLKLLVNLKRNDATANTQNVLFVGKYPLNITSTSTDIDDSYWDSSLSGIADNITKEHITVSQSLCAWDTITLSDVVVESGVNVIAYDKVVILPGTVIQPNVRIDTGFPNGNEYGSLPPIDISTIDCDD